jgi:hypothetical protein
LHLNILQAHGPTAQSECDKLKVTCFLQSVATAEITADFPTDVVNGASLGKKLLGVKLVDVEPDFLDESVDVDAEAVSSLGDLCRNGYQFTWRRSELILDE